ncbi:MAG: hypothetical protein MJH10_03465 [Epibacterium sp.]|nr:hypothetical protein [Epibacterium sp.]NQX72614.1 hypothetical protein [Epibacterium sp.]
MTPPDVLVASAEKLVARMPELSPLSAGILRAADLGLAQDSRSFAQKMGLAHALVLRECVILAEELGLIALEMRNDRSQRLFYRLSAQGQVLLKETFADDSAPTLG